MAMPKRITIKGPDEFDVLSAIWILASNDENPSITYEGIKYRLNLPTDYDVRSLIASRGDLFRRGIPQQRLDRWKREMFEGKRVPSWLREIDDDAERQKRIQSLTTDDVFRSQFRAERDSPQSQIEVITWDLEHIDRLRRANLESWEQAAKTWQVAIAIGIGILNLIVTLIVAFKP